MDRITANLPSRNFGETALFYEALGFQVGYRSDQWMIVSRGTLVIEFFRLDHKPQESCFGACVRVADLDGLYSEFQRAELPMDCWSIPRISPPDSQHGFRMFALVDPDGSLLRCIEDRSA